jgi:hypothetical protein
METTRELYKQKYEAQLHEWTARIEEIGAHTDKLTAEARLKAKPQVEALYGKLATARTALVELAAATDDKWDDLMKGADHIWGDFKAAAEGAYDALKADKKR